MGVGITLMSSCGDCIYYNGQSMACLISNLRQTPNNHCDNYKADKPKQETKQMKDYIVEKHEVNLDGQWWDIEPFVDTVDKIMFSDPRPQLTSPVAPAPQPAVPVGGAFKVSHLMIYKTDSYYRTSRTMRVMLNQDLDIVEKIKANYAEAEPSPGCFYATVILD